LALFVRWLQLDRSVISGALTMSLLILPVIIIASREALAAVPPSLREAAYALGASRWQTVRHHVLPAAVPGILTGLILGLSRAIGETAPLIMIGALTWVTFTPGGSFLEEYPHTLGGMYDWFTTALTDPFTVMPIQIFNWATQPQPEFHHLAAAGIIVLLGTLIVMNATAVAIRAWQQRRA
jgi:phosphate transport system permease protein